MRKTLWIPLSMLLLSLTLAAQVSNPAFPSGGLSNLGTAANYICANLLSVLPPLLVMLVVAAGIIYAAGQVFGAETRSRANTWATALLIGAIIGTLIIIVAPSVLAQLYNNPSLNFTCGTG